MFAQINESFKFLKEMMQLLYFVINVPQEKIFQALHYFLKSCHDNF